LTPQHAQAAFKSGNDLYSDCTTPRGSSTYYQADGYCTGFVMGVYDDFDLSRQLEDKEACLPGGVTAGQLRDVVVAFIRDNPKWRNLDASALIRAAIIDAWPSCK